MRDVADLERPRVGLLNVGEEPGKGDERAVATHRLLRADTEINFIGNVEGHRIIEGACDVLVCDGFAGNVLLKFYESGAPLLGVNGVSVVCHGASPPNAIKNAIRVAGSCVESGMVEDMAADLGSMSRTARVWRRIRRR
jgi:glycerol-3-phosphate acyltransferase PlsX